MNTVPSRLLRVWAVVACLVAMSGSSHAQSAPSDVSVSRSELLSGLNELNPDLLEKMFTEYSSHAVLTSEEQGHIKTSFSTFVAALRQGKIKDREMAAKLVNEVVGGKFAHLLILRGLAGMVERSTLPAEIKAEINWNSRRFAEGVRKGSISEETAREIFGRSGELNDQMFKEIGDALKQGADHARIENRDFRVDLAQELENEVKRCVR